MLPREQDSAGAERTEMDVDLGALGFLREPGNADYCNRVALTAAP